MSNPTFPSLLGRTWNVVQRPNWNTFVEQAASGAEFRTGLMQYPIWEFDLTYDFMTTTDLQNLMGLYLNMQGGLSAFYFDNPNDDTIASGSPYGFGTGNGSNKVFNLLKPMGTFVDLVGGTTNNWGTNPATNNVIYDNGTPVSAASYSASDGGAGPVITFTTAPTSGHALTWSGKYLYACRFKDDHLDFNQFAQAMYEQKGLTLRSVR